MNPRLYRIELTRTGINRFHDLQAAHSAIAESTTNSRTRVLWAMPRKGLIIARADTFEPRGGLFREIRHAPYEVDTQPGNRITLSTIINPVKIKVPSGKAAVIPESETKEWLDHRLRGSVELDQPSVKHLGPRRGNRGDMTVTITWRAVHSTATVIDPDVLRRLARDGIGRGRAYGCGLLLITGAGE